MNSVAHARARSLRRQPAHMSTTVRTHEEAADRHKEAADFNELHAAAGRELGHPDKAERMEARADVARAREGLERGRADTARERVEEKRRRLDDAPRVEAGSQRIRGAR